MTEADILHWIRDTSLGVAVRQSRWMFATGETLHFLGLSLLVGGILIVVAERKRLLVLEQREHQRVGASQ